jgi:hypothetical protein
LDGGFEFSKGGGEVGLDVGEVGGSRNRQCSLAYTQLGGGQDYQKKPS